MLMTPGNDTNQRLRTSHLGTNDSRVPTFGCHNPIKHPNIFNGSKNPICKPHQSTRREAHTVVGDRQGWLVISSSRLQHLGNA